MIGGRGGRMPVLPAYGMAMMDWWSGWHDNLPESEGSLPQVGRILREGKRLSPCGG